MGVYSSILTACKDVLTDLLEADGWKVSLNNAPRWVQLTDQLPGVVVAPRDDLSEVILDEAFEDGAVIGYEVYVGSFVDDRAQQTQWLFKGLDVRETIRLALWSPGVLNLTGIGEYDVDYDPSGAGGVPAPANVKGSWQKFVFKFSTERAAD